MASQSLYRKWRSQTFSDLVGQEPVIRTLKNALNGGTLAHAYLFTGPRGTGKTSTARLLAKTINCPNAKDGEPCNTCEQCREITAGNSFNVIEIDAASNRGIDSIRDLREKVMMPPTTGKYKVYILDEAHMLTTEAFNALLKTLEEPPPHAIFVMATTDVHKMLPTVLSRCQRFDFKRITTQQIVQHLNYIAGQEQVELERSAGELIARAAAGGMRDALSLLDQAIAYAGEHVTLAQVQIMLGVADPRAIQKFIMHIAQLDSAGGLHLINELVEAGADLRQVNNQVAEFWRAMMLARAGADIATIIDGTQDEINEIQQTAQLFVLEELTECARIFAQNELVQKSQGTPQLGLELGLLHAIALHRGGGQPAVIQPTPSPSTPSRTVAPRPEPGRTSPVPAQAPPPVVQPKISASAAPIPPPEPREDVAAKQSEELPEWEGLSYPDDEEFEPVAIQQAATMPSVSVPDVAPEQAEDASPTLTLEDVKERWEYVKRRVKTRKDGAKIAALLNGCSVVRVEETGGVPVVIVMASAIFHYTALQKEGNVASLEWALKVELARECSVRLIQPGSGGVNLAPVIPPPASNRVASSNRAASTVPSSAPQSAHLERPPIPIQEAGPSLRIVPQRQESPDSSLPRKQEIQREAPTSEQKPALTLVKRAVVKENTHIMSALVEEDVTLPRPQENGATRQETAVKKVKHDPVVQEVVRMFKADIKDVHLK